VPPVTCPDIFIRGRSIKLLVTNWQFILFDFQAIYGKIKSMPRWTQILLAIVLGLAVGLFYGWKISPVEFVDTTPDSLRVDYRSDYVLMVAEAYQAERDLDLAARRLAILGSESPTVLVAKAYDYGRQNGYTPDDLTYLQDLALDLQGWQPNPEGSLQ
jgi:hypothetical protein